jgi:hypothetical protein
MKVYSSAPWPPPDAKAIAAIATLVMLVNDMYKSFFMILIGSECSSVF